MHTQVMLLLTVQDEDVVTVQISVYRSRAMTFRFVSNITKRLM